MCWRHVWNLLNFSIPIFYFGRHVLCSFCPTKFLIDHVTGIYDNLSSVPWSETSRLLISWSSKLFIQRCWVTIVDKLVSTPSWVSSHSADSNLPTCFYIIEWQQSATRIDTKPSIDTYLAPTQKTRLISMAVEKYLDSITENVMIGKILWIFWFHLDFNGCRTQRDLLLQFRI